MKKRALCALVSLALCVTLAGQAAAAESSVSFVVNGITLAADVPNRVEARTTYVSYWPIVSALYPNATGGVGQWSGRGQGRRPDPPPSSPAPSISRPTAATCTCRTESSARATASWFPSEPCARRWAPGVEWDGTQSTIQITSGSGPILSGEQAYQADVVYWLSRIIYAESGNQPLDGKIAVGNVVLNRWPAPGSPTASTK